MASPATLKRITGTVDPDTGDMNFVFEYQVHGNEPAVAHAEYAIENGLTEADAALTAIETDGNLNFD